MALHDEYDIQVSAGSVSRRHALNFIAGAGIVVGVSDNAANDRSDVTVTNTGSTPPVVLPGDMGFLAWTTDPFNANTTAVLTSATIYLVAVWLRGAVTVSNIIVHPTVAGSGLTSGENFAGLYDATGAQAGITADQTTAWGSVGIKTMALTTPYSAAAGKYFIAIVSNGTTPPSLRCGESSGAGVTSINLGATGASMRAATNGTGTTLPSSLTLSSNSATGGLAIIAALS